MTALSNRYAPGTPRVSRRSLMEKVLVGAGSASVLAIASSVGVVLSDEARPEYDNQAQSPEPNHDSHMAAATGSTSTTTSAPTGDEIDNHHKQGIADFLKNQTTP